MAALRLMAQWRPKTGSLMVIKSLQVTQLMPQQLLRLLKLHPVTSLLHPLHQLQ